MKSRSLARLCVLAMLLLGMAPAWCAVRASVDSPTVSADGNVELTLEHDGQTSADPDLSPLRQDFDIISQSRSSNVEIMNGSMQSSVRVQLLLAPKRQGQLQIPSLTWGSDRSSPIVLNVGGAASGKSPADGGVSGAAQVFLRTTLEPQRSYVQSAFKLTVRMYAAVPIIRADLTLPANNDVLVQQMSSDKNETVVENGRRYEVVERHYMLFPQRSGSIELPGPVLNAQVPVQRADPFGNSFRDLFGNTPLSGFMGQKPIRVHGDAIKLDVEPRPAGAGGDYWLPAESVSLEGGWRPAQGTLKAGDPVTLDLHLKARGLTAAQLPDLNLLLGLPNGIKAYPDQAKLSNDTKSEALVGERDQSIALIADHAGDFSIPAMTVHWWDTASNQPREVTLPAHTLSFAPPVPSAVASLAPTPPPVATAEPARAQTSAMRAAGKQRDDDVRVWRAVSGSIALLWLLTLIAWYRYGRRPRSFGVLEVKRPAEVPRLDAGEAKAQLIAACRANDARGFRAALIRWIAASSGEEVTLREFSQKARDSRLSELLGALDRACYAGSSWDGAALLAILPEFPMFLRDPERKETEELAPLYR